MKTASLRAAAPPSNNPQLRAAGRAALSESAHAYPGFT